MIGTFLRFALIAIWLWPLSAGAEPIKLKLAFFTSDRSLIYQSAVKPFVDAVNAEGKGLLKIEVFSSGVLGRDPAQQAQLVRDGVADIAHIVPGYTADQFPDNDVLNLPGLFSDLREACLVYTRMVAANALRGYDDFVMIAAVMPGFQSIHTRRPIASLADLKGLKIRANNFIGKVTLEKLGIKGMIVHVNELNDALNNGAIDGAAFTAMLLTEFGLGRLTNYHYMLDADAIPLGVVMSRQKFNSLPQRAQDIIRKYSGEWLAKRYSAIFADLAAKPMAELQSDPRRKVIFPSPADLTLIQAAFKQVADEWASQTPRNRELLGMVQAEIAKLRSGQ